MEKPLVRSLDVECSFLLALVFPQALLQLLRSEASKWDPCARCILPSLARVGFPVRSSIPEGRGWVGPVCIPRPAWAPGRERPLGVC